MRVAALADIHGNLPALEAVLRDVEREKPDLVVFCGDVVSGLMPAETIDLLQAIRGGRFVRGNADRGLVDEFDGKPSESPGPFADWCAKQINRMFFSSRGRHTRFDCDWSSDVCSSD